MQRLACPPQLLDLYCDRVVGGTGSEPGYVAVPPVSVRLSPRGWDPIARWLRRNDEMHASHQSNHSHNIATGSQRPC